jgi:hypothetical protein
MGALPSGGWQHTGSYLRILGRYARYATPGPTGTGGHSRRPFWRKTVMAGLSPAITRNIDRLRLSARYFHSTFITS